MTNLKEENKKPSDYIKEAENFANQQKQQVENTTSNFQDTTHKVTNTINEYQNTNNYNLQKSIDTVNKYQQETINTIQSITNNTIELQKNITNTFQTVFTRFLDDTSKSYWNNYLYPQRYTDIYNKTNQNVTETTVNATRPINDVVLAFTGTFNKSIEIAQKYYNESAQNYFNFVNKMQKSIYKHFSEPRLLGLIGQAEMKKEIEGIVKEITQRKSSLERETNTSIVLDKKALKKYINFVIRETKKGANIKEE